MRKLLRSTCLRPHHSLRQHLVRSFGSIAFLTICVVVLLSSFATKRAGEIVQDQARFSLQCQVLADVQNISSNLADVVSRRFDNLDGAIMIQYEIIRDRIVGYPSQGWENDELVPFTDVISGGSAYPIRGPTLLMDWDSQGRDNLTDYPDHLRDGVFDSTIAMYRFQGNCNPAVTDPLDRDFFPNCTSANNDVATGGVIAPVSSNFHLAEKAADIGALIKPIWEAHTEILYLEVGFHNSGAGSQLIYPAFHADSRVSYISSGCDWMLLTNPFTGKPYGSREEMDRCHPAGAIVNEREYNALEQEWCIDQILHPEEIRTFGPYLNEVHSIWLLIQGRAVFDRITGEFIACTSINIELTAFKEVLGAARLEGVTEFVLAKKDGTIVVGDDELWDPVNGNETKNVVSTNFLPLDVFEIFLSEPKFQGFTENCTAELDVVSSIVWGDEVYASAPIPLPVQDVDTIYNPIYILLIAINETIFSPIDEVDEAVERDVREVVVVSMIVGLAGLLIVALFIWSMARMLTLPLKWMENVSWGIVNHNDERVGSDLGITGELHEDDEAVVRFAPRTEVNELVEEFRLMIKGFSGKGASQVAQRRLTEVQNQLQWRDEYKKLYSQLGSTSKVFHQSNNTDTTSVSSDHTPDSEPTFLSASTNMEARESQQDPHNEVLKQSEQGLPSESQDSGPGASSPKSNSGRNCTHRALLQMEEQLALDKEMKGYDTDVCRSRLFVWITMLVVLPLLCSGGIVFGIISQAILKDLPAWLDTLEGVSYSMSLMSLQHTATLRASLSQAVMAEPIRDLHISTRVMGWLLLGSLRLGGGIAYTSSGTEECKDWALGECPLIYDTNTRPCSCDWRDPRPSIECWDYQSDSRYLQHGFFVGQSTDADPESGRRSNVSFPLHSTTANTTEWWTEDIRQMPGWNDSLSFGGSETTFNRYVTSAASDVIHLPLYNYIESLSRSKHLLGVYFGYEEDGFFSGYGGCNIEPLEMAHFESSDDNKANFFGGDELCPLGKWGFDPRCRGWYVDGLKHGEEGGAVFITAPYSFVASGDVATSATSAIFNPQTGEHLGQALLDFTAEGLFSRLVNDESEISFVLSPANDASTGGDIVVGPNHAAGSFPALTGDVVLPNDTSDSDNRRAFDENIVLEMKAGHRGIDNFTRSEGNGTSQEYSVAYVPIRIRSWKVDRPDNFSESVHDYSELVYSLAIARSEERLRSTFTDIQDFVNSDLDDLLTVYMSLFVLLLVVVVGSTCYIAAAIATPMILLRRIVRIINSGRLDGDIPPMEGIAPVEANQVYNSFAKLFKIVQVSNTAFFSGNLDWAFHFVRNALRLFRKVEDKKAVGVACNNLGNTMLAMYCERATRGTCCEVDGFCLAERGRMLLNEAIATCNCCLAEAPTTIEKAEFAEQLANRLFNRALFLYYTQDDPCAAANDREACLADIAEARRLDGDVSDFWMSKKLMLVKSAQYFDRMLRRLRGLVDLAGDSAIREIWDAHELVSDLDRLLSAAWDNPQAPLFREINRIGRLQQLEGAVIQLETTSGNLPGAATLAIRMLVEDEYILESSFLIASNALLSDFNNKQNNWSAETIAVARQNIKAVRRNCKIASQGAVRSLTLCLEIGNSWSGTPALAAVSKNFMTLYDDLVNDDAYVSAVATGGCVSGGSVVDEILVIKPKKKRHQKRSEFQLATSCTSGGPLSQATIPKALAGLAACEECNNTEASIVAVVDGSSIQSTPLSIIKRKIEKLNQDREISVNIVIIGLNLTADLVEGYRDLCSVSRKSKLIECTDDSIDAAFEKVYSTAFRESWAARIALGGLTMEKF